MKLRANDLLPKKGKANKERNRLATTKYFEGSRVAIKGKNINGVVTNVTDIKGSGRGRPKTSVEVELDSGEMATLGLSDLKAI